MTVRTYCNVGEMLQNIGDAAGIFFFLQDADKHVFLSVMWRCTCTVSWLGIIINMFCVYVFL